MFHYLDLALPEPWGYLGAFWVQTPKWNGSYCKSHWKTLRNPQTSQKFISGYRLSVSRTMGEFRRGFSEFKPPKWICSYCKCIKTWPKSMEYPSKSPNPQNLFLATPPLRIDQMTKLISLKLYNKAIIRVNSRWPTFLARATSLLTLRTCDPDIAGQYPYSYKCLGFKELSLYQYGFYIFIWMDEIWVTCKKI